MFRKLLYLAMSGTVLAVSLPPDPDSVKQLLDGPQSPKVLAPVPVPAASSQALARRCADPAAGLSTTEAASIAPDCRTARAIESTASSQPETRAAPVMTNERVSGAARAVAR